LHGWRRQAQQLLEKMEDTSMRMRLRFRRPGSRVLFCILTLTALVALAACQPQSPATAQSGSNNTNNASARNHVPAGTRPQFVRVTFTTSTTYDQARALLTSVGQVAYPWSCSGFSFDGTLSPTGQLSVQPVTTPPPSAEQDTPEMFAASHQFLVPSPTEQQMNQIAASDEVVALDAVQLPPCL
jgi:hypothetical protein